MKENRFKAFFYDAHKRLIGTEIIVGINGASDPEGAYRLASIIADSHYPDCVEIEVCELANKKGLQCWQH